MISPEHPKDLFKKQGAEKGRTVKHGVFHLSAIQLHLVLRLCLPFAEFVLFSTDLNTGNQCRNGYNKRQYIQYHAVYSPHFRIAAK